MQASKAIARDTASLEPEELAQLLATARQALERLPTPDYIRAFVVTLDAVIHLTPVEASEALNGAYWLRTHPNVYAGACEDCGVTIARGHGPVCATCRAKTKAAMNAMADRAFEEVMGRPPAGEGNVDVTVTLPEKLGTPPELAKMLAKRGPGRGGTFAAMRARLLDRYEFGMARENPFAGALTEQDVARATALLLVNFDDAARLRILAAAKQAVDEEGRA